MKLRRILKSKMVVKKENQKNQKNPNLNVEKHVEKEQNVENIKS